MRRIWRTKWDTGGVKDDMIENLSLWERAWDDGEGSWNSDTTSGKWGGWILLENVTERLVMRREYLAEVSETEIIEVIIKNGRTTHYSIITY